MFAQTTTRQPYIIPKLETHKGWKVMTAIQSVPITNFVTDPNSLERLMNSLDGE